MKVVDASSLAKYILREEGWRGVREHLAEEPLSLDLALAEISNAIWKHHILFKRASREEAEVMFEALRRLGEDVLTLEPFGRYLRRAVEIAVEEAISVYDALYLAQAEKIGVLVTSDSAQAEAARRLGIEVRYVP